MACAIGSNFERAVKLALQADLLELAQRYIRKAAVLVSGEERKQLWLQVAKKLILKDMN